MAQPQQSVERRVNERVAAAIKSIVRTVDGELPCEIVNLSVGGVRIATDELLAPGTKVAVEVHDLGRFPGIVVWSHDGHHGIRFDAESHVIWRYLGYTWTSFENLDQ